MTFEQKHPDIVALYSYDKLNTFRSITSTGRIIEAWDKDENGVWHDVTLREQAIEQAKRELEQAKREYKKMETKND